MNKIEQYVRDLQLDAMRIGGKKVGAGRTPERNIAVFNPFSGAQIGSVPKATLEEVRAVFALAHACRPQLTRFERAAILNRAAAIVHARVDRVVFGAWDPRAGAAGSLLDAFRLPGLNHRADVFGGVLAADCQQLLREFFAARR